MPAINTTELGEHRGLQGQARFLPDRGLAMSVGDRPHDLVSLRQVAEFLEGFR